MKNNFILAIEAAYSASIALADSNGIVDFYLFQDNRKVSDQLAHEVSEMFKKHQLQVQDFSDFLINIGPGSYTGTRVALSFINGLSQTCSAKLTAMNSFDLLKFENNENLTDLIYVLESKKDEIYIMNQSEMTVLKKTMLSQVDCKKLLSNVRSDLDEYIDKSKIIIKTFDAKSMIQAFHKNAFQQNQSTEILYLKKYGE
jgi:tRNA threonylcarbamoyl adenosine modification protein YeaZ